MTVASIIFWILTPWILLHAVLILWRFLLIFSRSSLLPIPISTSGRNRAWLSPSTQIHLKYLHLRVQSTALVSVLDNLCELFRSGALSSLRAGLIIFYDVGSAAAILGMLAAILLLCRSSLESGLTLSGGRKLSAEGGVGLARRDTEMYHVVSHTQTHIPVESTEWIQAIIPGVTVPVAHLPLIMMSVFLGQLVHEAGHALCAALDAVPVLSFGASLYVMIPSAFVSLSSVAMEALPPRARLRIQAAGPLHNAVVWLLIRAAIWSKIGAILLPLIGFEDVSAFGKVVVLVDEDSPLFGALPRGSLITRLDDVPLGRTGDAEDVWTTFLLGRLSPSPRQGWCIDKSIYLESNVDCCSVSPSPSDSTVACFIENNQPPDQYCLDPVPILTRSSGDKDNLRCTSSHDCGEGGACVELREPGEFLRLTVKPSRWLAADPSQEGVILWSGPTEEVYEQVAVGDIASRYQSLPLSSPFYVSITFQYLEMAMISLYLFNLLPLKSLDGGKALNSLLDCVLSNGPVVQYDLEMMEQGDTTGAIEARQTPWKHRTLHVIHWLTVNLLLVFVILRLVKSIRPTS